MTKTKIGDEEIMKSVRVQFVLIFPQPTKCSSVCRLRSPNDHRRQPVTEPEPMSLPFNHLSEQKQNPILISPISLQKSRNKNCSYLECLR